MNFKAEFLSYCTLFYVGGVALGVRATFRGTEEEWLGARLLFGGLPFSFWTPRLLVRVARGAETDDDGT